MAQTQYRYRINGVLNTGDSVLANMEQLANSCATWISYDMFTGLWDVVINKPEDTVMAFDDSNIIGGITLNGSGLRDTYNSVEVKFPHSDLNNQMDYIKITIPAEDRLPNEPDNTLNITYDLLNDPVQAQYLGLVELKQSRLDKIVTFRSDYSVVNLPAGAVISITNSMFGWTAKLFRIITIAEYTENGNLQSEITALEYDETVYSTDDLERFVRTNANGILTIGAIGQPDIPIVTKYEVEARPAITIDARVPGGLVSGIEYWVTYDTNIGSDDNRNYKLVGTILAPQEGTLTQGDIITFEYDALDNQDLLVKVRGINGDTSGPFSPVSGLIEFRPFQTTDGIGPNTQTLDEAGDPIAGLLAANALLFLLGQLFNGSTATGTPGFGGGSLFGSIFDLFASETGQDIRGIASSGQSIVSGIEAVTLNYGRIATQNQLNAMAAGYTTNAGYDLTNVEDNKFVVPLSTTTNYSILQFLTTSPTTGMQYEFLDSSDTQRTGVITAQATLVISVYNDITNQFLGGGFIDWSSQSNTISLTNVPAGSYRLEAAIVPTYDLDMLWSRGSLTDAESVHKLFMTNYNCLTDFKLTIFALGAY
jgi:hypothetical protein